MKTLFLEPGVGPTRRHVQVICAAEEMLEALQEAYLALTKIPQWEVEEAVITQVRDAIAKATGDRR